MNMIGAMRSFGTLAAVLCLIMISSGCASALPRPTAGSPPSIGEKAAKTAISMIGRPYRYRGESPAGFDCSGLVRYSYLAAGKDAPHGTKQLRAVTSPVGPADMREGDLLFFSENGKKYSHVGIYLEGDVFVHAPRTGGKVRKQSLQDPHWKKSFIEARRFP
jgi:cell wall-associated NlpC family hydrolase